MSVFDSHKQVVVKPERVIDVERVVKFGKNGEEIVTYEPVDNKKILEENGSFVNWSLTNLMKAGINPDFPIHTSSTSRLDVNDDVQSAIDEVDALLASLEKEETNTDTK